MLVKVHAAISKLHLVRLAARSQRQQLMAKANSKDGQTRPLFHHLLQALHCLIAP